MYMSAWIHVYIAPYSGTSTSFPVINGQLIDRLMVSPFLFRIFWFYIYMLLYHTYPWIRHHWRQRVLNLGPYILDAYDHCMIHHVYGCLNQFWRAHPKAPLLTLGTYALREGTVRDLFVYLCQRLNCHIVNFEFAGWV